VNNVLGRTEEYQMNCVLQMWAYGMKKKMERHTQTSSSDIIKLRKIGGGRERNNRQTTRWSHKPKSVVHRRIHRQTAR
jgi:hypothetical protein